MMGAVVTYTPLALSAAGWQLTIDGWAFVVAGAVVAASFMAWREQARRMAVLKRQLARYKAGPLFEIRWRWPMWGVLETGLRAGRTAFVTRVEVVNTGTTGVARDWRFTVELPSGERIPCSPLTLAREEVYGTGDLIGPFRMAETIEVRTQKRIKRNHQVIGFYYGTLPEGKSVADVIDGSAMIVECADQFGRLTVEKRLLPRVDLEWPSGPLNMKGLSDFNYRTTNSMAHVDWERIIETEQARLKALKEKLDAQRNGEADGGGA